MNKNTNPEKKMEAKGLNEFAPTIRSLLIDHLFDISDCVDALLIAQNDESTSVETLHHINVVLEEKVFFLPVGLILPTRLFPTPGAAQEVQLRNRNIFIQEVA